MTILAVRRPVSQPLQARGASDAVGKNGLPRLSQRARLPEVGSSGSTGSLPHETLLVSDWPSLRTRVPRERFLVVFNGHATCVAGWADAGSSSLAASYTVAPSRQISATEA